MTFNPDLIPYQQALKGLGYDPGLVDGKWGGGTEGATDRLKAAKGASVQRIPKPTVPADTRPSAGIIYQGSARYIVDEICLHCSDTRPDWMKGNTFAERFAEIRRWHMEDRGWKDLGYHWVIDRDGTLKAGRPETTIGAGVQGHNNGVIHACLLGGHGSAETDQFDDHFTPAQDTATRRLIAAIRLRTRITRVSGHNEWAAKACPGFYVPKWLEAA